MLTFKNVTWTSSPTLLLVVRMIFDKHQSNSKYKFTYTSSELQNQWSIDIEPKLIKAGAVALQKTLVADVPDKQTLVALLQSEFPTYNPSAAPEQAAAAYTGTYASMPPLSTGQQPSILSQPSVLTQTPSSQKTTLPVASKRLQAPVGTMSAYESASLALMQEQVSILRNVAQVFGVRPSAVSKALQVLKANTYEQAGSGDEASDSETEGASENKKRKHQSTAIDLRGEQSNQGDDSEEEKTSLHQEVQQASAAVASAAAASDPAKVPSLTDVEESVASAEKEKKKPARKKQRV